MSKNEEGKVVVKFEDEPLLADLDVPKLLAERQKFAALEKLHKTQKDLKSAAILVAVEAVKADTVVYTDDKGEWSITRVEGTPGETLDEEKLRQVIMRTFGVDMPRAVAVIQKAMVPKAAPETHIKVTAPKAEKPAKLIVNKARK